MAKRKSAEEDIPVSVQAVAPQKKARLEDAAQIREQSAGAQPAQPATSCDIDHSKSEEKTPRRDKSDPSLLEKKKGARRKTATSSINQPTKPNSRCVVRKLAPSRPFPVVPSSVAATGPKSAHHEGKNMICVTRKTSLAAYLRRCKRLVMEDGYKTIHLTALGAAIPLLATLSVSLPAIFPYPEDEIHAEVKTGTIELVDEVIPEDDDEDITRNTREKSTMCVIVRIGDGADTRPVRKSSTMTKRGKRRKVVVKEPCNDQKIAACPTRVVVQEQEQDNML